MLPHSLRHQIDLLESVFAFCAGCWVFAQAMKVGLVPEETCAACADISLRTRETAAA